MAASRKVWVGLRTRCVHAAAEPDGALRPVEIPAAWEDEAAAAVAALAPGRGMASLPALVDTLMRRLPRDLGEQASSLLLMRRLAPAAPAWQGEAMSGWVLNLAAFDEPGLGVDAVALGRAGALLAAIMPGATLRLTDLDGLIAAAGLDYDSDAGRALACRLLQTLRGSGVRLVVAEPDPVDALLGAEAGGVAPRFSWLDAAGRLSRAATASLAARGLSAETGLARMLAGRSLLPHAGPAAHAAMRAAVADLVALPPMRQPAPARPQRREPPARPGGYARKVTLGGHKVFVRTAEFEDGSPAELSLGLPRESAAVRALADSLSHVASLALQHGVPLDEIVELLAGTRFGPAGAVDGDAEVGRASSPLDYLARSIAAAYLPDLVLPEPELDAPPPLLPLEMPAQRRPALRLVG